MMEGHEEEENDFNREITKEEDSEEGHCGSESETKAEEHTAARCHFEETY